MSEAEDEQGWQVCVEGVELAVDGPPGGVRRLAESLSPGICVRIQPPEAASPGSESTAGVAYFHVEIVECGVPLDRAWSSLAAWLEEHGGDLAEADARKEIWLNLPFWSTGSQWVTLPPSLLQQIGRADCSLVTQFSIAVSDEDLESLLARRRERRESSRGSGEGGSHAAEDLA